MEDSDLEHQEIEKDLGPVELVDFTAGPYAEVPDHDRKGPHACYVVEGGFRDDAENGQVGADTWCAAGTSRLSPAGDRHLIRFGPEGGRCLLLHVTEPAALGHTGRVERKLVRSELLDARLQLLRRMITKDEQATQPVLLSEVRRVFSLAELHARSGVTDAPAWLERARGRLDHHMTSRTELGRLASEVGVHPVHLSRSFRQYFGTTLTNLTQLRRLSAAHELLVESDLSLSEIAYRTGYSDQPHMTRAFTRWFGTLPAASAGGDTGTDVPCPPPGVKRLQDFADSRCQATRNARVLTRGDSRGETRDDSRA